MRQAAGGYLRGMEASSPNVSPPTLPTPCGVLSTAIVRALTGTRKPGPGAAREELHEVEDPLTDRDFQLALWMLYELHYRGFEDVDPAAEWDPVLVSSRGMLERRFEESLRELVGPPLRAEGAEETVAALERMTGGGADSELASFLRRYATAAQFREYLAAGAIFRLHESDPQSFVLPRIGGRAKAAFAELQYDEYGAGRPDRVHATLYGRALRSLGMPVDVTTYVEMAPAPTLAAVNTMSLLGLNRAHRGAALGHLAAYEATSSLPCRMIAEGARRLGLPAEVVDYFDEHVEADAVHEQLAIRGVCGALVADEPDLADDVLFGAAACLAVEALAGEALLCRWRDVPVADAEEVPLP